VTDQLEGEALSEPVANGTRDAEKEV